MRADGTDGYDETGSRFLQLFDAYQNTELKKNQIKRMKANETDRLT